MDPLDSPYMARSWCPGCEPNCDPTLEILETRWCDTHTPSRHGEDDGVVVSAGYMSGSTEAGGEDGKRMCDLIHRGA